MNSVQPLTYFKEYSFLEYCLINNDFENIKQSLNKNPKSFLTVNIKVLVTLIKVLRHDDVLKFLNILSDEGKDYFLNFNDEELFLYNFLLFGNEEQIDKLLKFKISFNSFNKFLALPGYLRGLLLTDINESKFLKIIALFEPASKKFSKYINTISEVLHPFNKKMFDLILKVYPDGLTTLCKKTQPILTIALTNNYVEAFDYFVQYLKKTGKPGINHFILLSPIIAATRLENNYFISELLKFPNLDLNVYDRLRNTPAHYAIKSKVINFNLIKEIVKRTNNINLQNLNGSTVLYYICKYDFLEEMQDILKQKLCDVFVTNKNGKTPLSVCSNIELLKEIVTKGFINNSNKTEYNGKILPLLKESKKSKSYYNKIFKCISNSINLKVNVKIPIEKPVELSNFQYNNAAPYIFLLYYVKKYGVKLFTDCKVELLVEDEFIDKANALTANKELWGLDIFWKDKMFRIVISNFGQIIKKLKKGVYFVYLTLSGIVNFHQNGLIIDVKKKLIIRFEPNGAKTRYIVNDGFNEYIGKICKECNYKYLSPDDYLDANSFQVFSDSSTDDFRRGDPDGHCLVWTLWFLELYMKNPNVELKELVNVSINKILNLKISFRDYIRAYSSRLLKFEMKYIKSLKYDSIKILQEHVSDDDLMFLYKKIVSQLNVSMSKTK